MRTRTLTSAAAATAAIAIPLLPATAQAVETPPEVVTHVDPALHTTTALRYAPIITATVPNVVPVTSQWTTVTVRLHSTWNRDYPGLSLGQAGSPERTKCGTLPAGGDLLCDIPLTLWGRYDDNVGIQVGADASGPMGAMYLGDAGTIRLYAAPKPVTTESLTASPSLIAVGDSTRVNWTRLNPNPVTDTDAWTVAGEVCPPFIDAWDAVMCSVDVTPTQPGRSVTGSVHHPGNDVAALTPVPVTVVAWPTATIARTASGDVDVTLTSAAGNVVDLTAAVGTETITISPGGSEVVHLGRLKAEALVTVSLGAADGDEAIAHRVALTGPAEMGIPGPTTPEPTTPEPTKPEPTTPEPTTPAPTTPEPTKPGPTLPLEGPSVHRVTHIGADVADGGPMRSAAPAGVVAALVAVAGAGLARRRRLTLDG